MNVCLQTEREGERKMSMTITEAAETLAKELLPYAEKRRDNLISEMTIKLNQMLDKDEMEHTSIDIKWNACSFCPRDALSIFTKPKNGTFWTEETAILFIWDQHGKNIVGFEAMPNMRARLVSCPGYVRKIYAPTVRFSNCTA